MRTVVVGAGVFGLSTALALAGRGHDVVVVDPGPVPHPLAASTGVSRLVRNDYGSEELYVDLMDLALAGWQRWNEEWDGTAFHRDGLLLMRRSPMRPGGFEHDGFRALARRGVPVERVDAQRLRRDHPAWDADTWVDGYRNPTSGWAWSSRVVERMAARAASVGARHVAARVVAIADDGVRLADGSTVPADTVVVAAGAWTARLVEGLAGVLRVSAHPVVQLRPADPAAFRPPAFPPWTAEVATTGYYGFPLHPDGTVKVGRHAEGEPLDPDTTDRSVPGDVVAAFRDFLAGVIPALADAELVATRRCCYVDTPDGDFWIDRVPGRAHVVVATGGSGHGFKFAPVIGDVVADVVEDVPSPFRSRFAWREVRAGPSSEQARAGG